MGDCGLGVEASWANNKFEEHLPDLLHFAVFLGWNNYWLKELSLLQYSSLSSHEKMMLMTNHPG